MTLPQADSEGAVDQKQLHELLYFDSKAKQNKKLRRKNKALGKTVEKLQQQLEMAKQERDAAQRELASTTEQLQTSINEQINEKIEASQRQESLFEIAVEARTQVSTLNQYVERMRSQINNKATKRALARVSRNLIEFLKVETSDPIFVKLYNVNPVKKEPDEPLIVLSD